MPSLVELIKQAAMDAVRESKPTEIVFGQVISISPLKIQVDQKLILGEAQLILTNSVEDHEVQMTVDGVKKTYTVHNALKVDENVMMLQVQGGQKFIVIERR